MQGADPRFFEGHEDEHQSEPGVWFDDWFEISPLDDFLPDENER